MGKIRSGVASRMDDIRIISMLKNTTGTIIKFVFAITFNGKRFAIVQLTMKNSTIYIVGDVGK